MELQEKKTNYKKKKLLKNIFINSVFLLTFVIVIEKEATGIAIHEWLGVAIMANILLHVLIHWDWVVKVTKGFFSKIHIEPKMNYFLDLCILIGFTTIIFSGLMISEIVLPLFGLRTVESGYWKFLHFRATDVTIVLVGVHLGLHYKWLLSIFKTLILQPVRKIFIKKEQILNPFLVPLRVSGDNSRKDEQS